MTNQQLQQAYWQRMRQLQTYKAYVAGAQKNQDVQPVPPPPSTTITVAIKARVDGDDDFKGFELAFEDLENEEYNKSEMYVRSIKVENVPKYHRCRAVCNIFDRTTDERLPRRVTINNAPAEWRKGMSTAGTVIYITIPPPSDDVIVRIEYDPII